MSTNPAIYAALAKALPLVDGAKKDSNNPHFRSKYADLGSVIEAIRPVANAGIWFRQMPIEHDDGACIETFYVHKSGELPAGKCFVPASKKDAQGFGSAMTYARRYGLMAAFGIAPEDDDGNAATKAPPDPSATISEAQFNELDGLFNTKDADKALFCQAYKISSLKALPAAKFDEAKQRILSKPDRQPEAA